MIQTLLGSLHSLLTNFWIQLSLNQKRIPLRKKKLMTINLNNAAKYYKELSHQIAALEFLESKIPDEILDEFAEIYRAGPANPSSRIITPQICQQLTGYSADKFDETFCGDFNKLLMAAGFDKHRDAMCMLIGNLLHETGNFRWMSEIADGSAYEMRKDLGNIYPGDGKNLKALAY